MIVDQIKSALPLPAYLAEHGFEFQGRRCRCIKRDHEDRHASGGLYRGNDGFTRLHCFACGFDVDVIGAAQELHGLDFNGTLRLLAARAGILSGPITPTERRKAQKARSEREAVKRFNKWCQNEVNEIAKIFKSYYRMRRNRTTFTEAELQDLAIINGNITRLKYHYDILCSRNDKEKYQLYREVA